VLNDRPLDLRVMEIAAIVSIVLLDYIDFALIVGLLLMNSIIGTKSRHDLSSSHLMRYLNFIIESECECYLSLLRQSFRILGGLYIRECCESFTKANNPDLQSTQNILSSLLSLSR
jgi:hypothetical protein